MTKKTNNYSKVYDNDGLGCNFEAVKRIVRQLNSKHIRYTFLPLNGRTTKRFKAILMSNDR